MKKRKMTVDSLTSKGFGVLLIILSVWTLLLLLHHIFSYEAIMRPRMDFLIANSIITNDRAGYYFLYMFTNQSNIFVLIFAFLTGLAYLGCKPLKKVAENDALRGAVTLYILVTGIIYTLVLLPFSESYPMEKGIWFSNVHNFWYHVVVPVLTFAWWLKPNNTKKYSVKKVPVFYLLYPVVYFVFSVINGAIVDFYPYPFLNAQQMWSMLFAQTPYNSLYGTLLMVAVVVVFCAIFYGLGALLITIHNKRVDKYLQNAAA